jgi:hypothetical protein
MAYVSQELKKSLAPKIKGILKQYGLKGTLAVSNHMTLVLNIKSGDIDFASQAPYAAVNTYYIDKHWSGIAADALNALNLAMNAGNHNNSDIQTDYFDVGWYVDINIGRWDKPYQYTGNH